MAEPWTAVRTAIVKGSGFLRLLPTTLEGSKIKTIKTTDIVDIVMVAEESAKYPDRTPKQEEITKELSTGVTVKFPKTTTFVSGATGYLTGETLEYSFEMKCLIGKANYDKIRANLSAPFFAVKGKGYDVTGTHLGFQYLIGYVSGLEYPTKADAMELTLTVKGGFVHELDTGVTLQALNTALTASIEPVGRPALTPTALENTDLPLLLGGQIVDKD